MSAARREGHAARAERSANTPAGSATAKRRRAGRGDQRGRRRGRRYAGELREQGA